MAGIDRLARREQVSVDELRVGLQRAAGNVLRLRRVVVSERLGKSEQRRRIFVVRFDRRLERFDRLGLVVLFEEELAPSGVDGRIARGGCGRVAIRCVRFLKTSDRSQRTRRAREIGGLVGGLGARRDPLERCGGVGPAEHLLQETQFERRVARGRLRGDRLQRGLGLGVAAAGDRDTRLDRGGARIAGVRLVSERDDFVLAAFEQRTLGELERRRGASGRLRGGGERKDGDR
jgi:hypothetical protein